MVLLSQGARVEIMFSDAAGKSTQLTDTQQITRDAGRMMSRKIWLPKIIYNALPYFYILAGAGALFATIYISDWVWLLPHYLIFAVACLHMGVLVYRRRHKPRS